ncbi:MAG: serine/threonine protein kinase [Aureliella sp.]
MSKSPGNEPPEFIRVLLSAEEDSAEFAAAAAELENHPEQASMLEEFALGGLETDGSWAAIQQTLTLSGLPEQLEGPATVSGDSSGGSRDAGTVFFAVDTAKNTPDTDGVTAHLGSGVLLPGTGVGKDSASRSVLSDEPHVEDESIVLDFLDPPTHPELLGRFGRYEIERVIGMGGMGVVLRAFDSDLHRVVAIKVLAPHLAHSSTARRRFAREAQAAAAVVHPNVIQIHDVDCENKAPHLVMQYVPGESLERRVGRTGGMSVPEALRVGLQTAAALQAAHAQGLVHRDVKPANILLEEKVGRVVLSDFGLARTADDASLTKTGIVAGTPHYMSPEQANGAKVDHQSDLFSLGSVLYFMLTGTPPFRAEGAMAVLNKICRNEIDDIQDRNPEVPREVAELIARCLAKDPSKRIQTASELHAELQALLTAYQAGGLSFVSARDRRKGSHVNSSWGFFKGTATGVAERVQHLSKAALEWIRETDGNSRMFLVMVGMVIAILCAAAMLWRPGESSGTQSSTGGVREGGDAITAAEYYSLANEDSEMQSKIDAIQSVIDQLRSSDTSYESPGDSFGDEVLTIQQQLETLRSGLDGPDGSD